ncbi:hypothetical protein HDR61_04400 [bacterium]|nr:hypothetical protein [bacterium]
MQKHFSFLLAVFAISVISGTGNCAATSVASTEYVQYIVDALNVPEISSNLNTHIADTENPHGVTAQQVGLGNVQNIDTTNANNLTSGTVNIARLPVGNADNTIASGADARFDTISMSEPTGTPADGRVYVWFD